MKRARVLGCALALLLLTGCTAGARDPAKVAALRAEYPAYEQEVSMASVRDMTLREALEGSAPGCLAVFTVVEQQGSTTVDILSGNAELQEFNDSLTKEFGQPAISGEMEFFKYRIKITDIVWTNEQMVAQGDKAFEIGGEYMLMIGVSLEQVAGYLKEPDATFIADIGWDHRSKDLEGYLDSNVFEAYYLTKDGYVLSTHEQGNEEDKKYDGMTLEEFRKTVGDMMKGWVRTEPPEDPWADYSSKPFDQQEVAPTPTYK